VPAVALFVERAQAANPRFPLDASSARVVVELCRRLDGLPLAIELAAARSRALQPGMLLERDGRLDLLRGLRDHPDRHASLRTVLDWSYHLLSQSEQVLLRRLSVFAGGCTFEAAQAVCSHGLSSEPVLDLLGRLVDRSLVVVEPDPSGSRFRLLETVREYAAEQLEASGEREAVQRQHAVWFLSLAEQAAPHIWGPDTRVWLERLERDHDNLRAVLAWSFAAAAARPDNGPTAAEVGLRLGAALMLFWDLRGSLQEGRSWLERLLALQGVAPAPRSAWVIASFAAAYVTFTQGDYDQAIIRWQATLDLAREAEHGVMQAQALLGLGAARVLQGRDLHEAQQFLREAISVARANANIFALSASHYWSGEAARVLGDLDQARTQLLECLALTRKVANLSGTAYVLASLGRIALAEADLRAARSCQQQSLALRRDLDDRRGIAFCLEELAWVAGLDGRFEEAARLFGASAALHEELGLPLVPVSEWRSWHERAEAAVREHLGAERYAAAWGAGRALGRADAIALALA
jgi:non-specific serine/threonine protein kinase